jgi:hypothetical protein
MTRRLPKCGVLAIWTLSLPGRTETWVARFIFRAGTTKPFNTFRKPRNSIQIFPSFTTGSAGRTPQDKWTARAVSWDLKHREVSGGDPVEVAASRQYSAKHGPQSYWQKKLADSKKAGAGNTYANTAYQTAALAAHLGEKNDAFQFLERAFAERSFWMPFLNADPLFDNLRGDPRFQNLLERVGFSK